MRSNGGLGCREMETSEKRAYWKLIHGNARWVYQPISVPGPCPLARRGRQRPRFCSVPSARPPKEAKRTAVLLLLLSSPPLRLLLRLLTLLYLLLVPPFRVLVRFAVLIFVLVLAQRTG